MTYGPLAIVFPGGLVPRYQSLSLVLSLHMARALVAYLIAPTGHSRLVLLRPQGLSVVGGLCFAVLPCRRGKGRRPAWENAFCLLFGSMQTHRGHILYLPTLPRYDRYLGPNEGGAKLLGETRVGVQPREPWAKPTRKNLKKRRKKHAKVRNRGGLVRNVASVPETLRY